MKRLFFLMAFLVTIGTSGVYAQLAKTVTLTTPNTLASALGDDAANITSLTLIGPLGEDDFNTMKERMNMLQVLDMSGVTELPMAEKWNEEGNEWHELPGIPANSFQKKLTLRIVIFPEVLKVIGQEAFLGCNNLEEVDFSKAIQLQYIENHAFNECSGLRTLDLSTCASLVEIGINAFYFCSNLQTVNLSGCRKLTNIKIGAFSTCTSLQTVDLSNCSALITLESSVFDNCSNLTSVRLEGCIALNTIEEYAFSYCNKLSDFDFSQLTALKEIGSNAFNSCALTGNITFASGIRQIGGYAFVNNEAITSIDFSNSPELAVISAGTFELCKNLKKIDFSNCGSLNTLNVDAFNGCLSLEEIIIDNGFYTSIDGVLFVVDKASLLLYPAGKKAKTYTIPSTVKTLGTHSFPHNESLTELTIPESVLTIKEHAFYDGSFPEGKRAKVILKAEKPIGLSQSIGLENALVCVPKGSANAYREAAIWCDSKIVETDADPVIVTLEEAGTLEAKLTVLDVPLATIQELRITGPMNKSDFIIIQQMELLQKVDLSKATLEDNILPNDAFYQDPYREDIIRLSYLEEVVLPNSIKEIGDQAFSNLSALRKMNLPEAIERIGASAFSNCSSLQKIDLSALPRLKEIAYEAFAFCSCVPKSLKFPDGLKTIGGAAFSNTGVTSVDLSNTSLEYIDYGAFVDCEIVGELIFPATLNHIGNNAFSSATLSSIKLKSPDMVELYENAFEATDRTTCKIYVPKGLKEIYKKNENWSTFQNIEEFGYLVTTSSQGAGWVEGGGAYETGETVILKAIADEDAFEPSFFDGWYENNKKISTESELTFVMGTEDRSLEARFYQEVMNFYGDNILNDQNKVDGSAVILHDGNLTVEGDQPWNPKSFAYYRDASLLVDSDIQTEEITCNWNTSGGYWYFVSFPYDLKMSEIKLTDSETRFVVREYDGQARANNGAGASWRQLSDSEILKANKGYIIQFNYSDGMADGFTTKSGNMKALLNRMNVTIPLNTYTSANAMDANWNFVGNPYPAYYSVEQLFADGLDATVTVWSPELNNYEYYTKDDEDVYLSPLTAFFVQKNTSNLIFSPEGRMASLPKETQVASSLRSTDNRQVVNLLLAGEKTSDRTRIVFNEEASLAYEIGLDAAKFSSPNGDVATFYSLDEQGNRLAINERPVADGVVHLGYDIPAQGTYTISLKEPTEATLLLVDKWTGDVCDLNKRTYAFDTEAGNIMDRFELRNGTTTAIESIDESVRWSIQGGLLTVSNLYDVTTLSIFDTAGRIHFAGKVTDGNARITLPQPGIYYMTWITKAGERQTRSIKW